jgi:hypothetical protein
MTENISAFDEFILGSAERYLQTVVLIDDRIYESTSGSVTAHLTKPTSGLRKSALKSVVTVSNIKGEADKKVEDVERPDEVSFHEVQNSFAKKRIICSLYQPKKGASFGERSDVYNLCSAADVVIVDWDLHGDFGNKATLLVGNLIEQSMKEIPHQLRLILIYTLEVNLRSVADKIYEDLADRIGKTTIDVNTATKGLVLTTDNARVVVLGKRENTSLPEYADFWVPEKKLAGRTINEFSRLASGLLQALVLRGVANLRENNRRILMRFHEDLDTAFLVHRALLLPNEAFGQIIPLLTDELRAVLEDTLGDYPLGPSHTATKIISDWCDKHWKPGDTPSFVIGDEVDPLEFAKDVFCNGSAIKKDYSRIQKSQIPGLVVKKEDGTPQWNDKKCVNLVEYLSSDCKGESCHEMLSSLMSQRIAYENAHRELHLGVILRAIVDMQRYMLCLQPVCDSVRINGKTRAFIFCCMCVPEAGKPFTHAVMDLKNNPIQLDYKPKVSNCYVSDFTTGADAVCATRDGDGRFIFEDESKRKYEWIAELKTEHAQRAAEEFGRTLSRVGLTESEWLRLKAKK